MTERAKCLVPYCRRTSGRVPPAHEWICSDHWKPVSRATKRYRARSKRILKKAEARMQRLQATQGGLTNVQLRVLDWAHRQEDLSWEKCKSEAIEKAAGIR